MSKKINYNKLEKSFSESVDFSEDSAFEVRTSLEKLCNCIITKFSAEEIAYFMFMLTDDGGVMEVEKKYLELMAEHYKEVSDDEDGYEDYKKLAEAYKNAIKGYS